MYSIKHAGAKGLGLFATKWIPRGTRIIAERPLITVKSENDVFEAMKTISDEDVNWIQHLSIKPNSKPAMVDRTNATWQLVRNRTLPTPDSISKQLATIAVFRNNNFDIGNGVQALFRDICRVNHSCVPNSQGNFNTAIGCFTIHATRPIEAEDEITISYLDEHGAPREMRKMQLLKSHGFTCECPICNADTEIGQKSEERRVRMHKKLKDYVQQLTLGSEKAGIAHEVQLLRDFTQMYEDEGLAGRELSTSYFSAAEGFMRYGDKQEAQKFAKLGLQMEEICIGTDNPLYEESVRRMRPIVGSMKAKMNPS